MQLPSSCDERRTVVVFEVLKGEPLHHDEEGLRQLATLCVIEIATVLLQLRLQHLAGGAVSCVARRFHHHAGRIFVRGGGDLEVQIAIAGLAVWVLPPVERPETVTRRGSARDDRQHHLPLAHPTVTEVQRVPAE